MQTALHTLIRSAQVCQPIKADLRQSTLTLAWPANSLIQRTDYVLLPKAEVEAAIANDADLVFFPASVGAGNLSFYRGYDGAFEFTRGSLELSCWFNRFREDEYPKQPGTWYGQLTLKDVAGNKWSRSLPLMVTNDFGDLVDLTTGERP